jgi:hypothetical protein
VKRLLPPLALLLLSIGWVVFGGFFETPPEVPRVPGAGADGTEAFEIASPPVPAAPRRSDIPAGKQLPEATKAQVSALLSIYEHPSAWAGGFAEPVDQDDLDIADYLAELTTRLKATHPVFESYPFLDPHEVLREFGGLYGGLLNQTVQNELLHLQKHPELMYRDWWKEDAELDRMLTSGAWLVSLPPTWILAAPEFGEVDLDTVLEQERLLRDIRREFLLYYQYYRLKKNFLTIHMDPDEPFNETIRSRIAESSGNADFISEVDFTGPFAAELQVLEDDFMEHQRQYLLALGNAVYAMELPTFQGD